jgi:NAD(P)-dependent dehydrogenase (short-subunit alcohol dehydrogenase family)
MTDLKFDGQVALITGAARGVGAEYARALAERGARVVINDLGGAVDGQGGSAAAAEVAAQLIRDAGGEAIADVNSVASDDGATAAVQTALDAYGRIDIVVNNAGILRDSSFPKMTTAALDTVLDVHLRGAFWVTQAAWKYMREVQYGRLVNTTSNAGLLGNFGQANYGAAKMGLVGLTKVLAREGAKSDIKVNAVAPMARTRMTEEMLGEIGAQLDPSLVAPIVVFLAHKDNPVSGEVYSAGAGVVNRFFVGATRGIYSENLSAELVRDEFERINDEADYQVYSSVNHHMRTLLQASKSESS